MERKSGECHDWELLHNLPESISENTSYSSANMRNFEGFEAEQEGMIQTDYFSLDSSKNYFNITASDQGSVESDNPSWVDPEPGSQYLGKEPHELWPDSSSDQSENCKFSGFDGENELGFVGNGETLVGFEGIGDIGSVYEFSSVQNELDLGHDSELGKGKDVNSDAGENIPTTENNENAPMEVVKAGGERVKKSVVWWKVPLELLKFCAFRVSPVWTLSMAAAVMGVVILTRRLHKMKKSHALQLKVIMDDKKVSQFMSRAARVNEAFSVVKRGPVIRPALPVAGGGFTQWPVMSLR